jgi:hypothetical protein
MSGEREASLKSIYVDSPFERPSWSLGRKMQWPPALAESLSIFPEDAHADKGLVGALKWSSSDGFRLQAEVPGIYSYSSVEQRASYLYKGQRIGQRRFEETRPRCYPYPERGIDCNCPGGSLNIGRISLGQSQVEMPEHQVRCYSSFLQHKNAANYGCCCFLLLQRRSQSPGYLMA